MAKVDYFLTIKDGTQVQDKLILLYWKLESCEARLSIAKSAVTARKACKAKLFEECMQ